MEPIGLEPTTSCMPSTLSNLDKSGDSNDLVEVPKGVRNLKPTKLRIDERDPGRCDDPAEVMSRLNRRIKGLVAGGDGCVLGTDGSG